MHVVTLAGYELKIPGQTGMARYRIGHGSRVLRAIREHLVFTERCRQSWGIGDTAQLGAGQVRAGPHITVETDLEDGVGWHWDRPFAGA